MANELITEVLKAESESRKLQNKAQATVKNLTEEAQTQARLLAGATIQQAQSAANLILSEAKVQSDGIKKQAEKLAVLREKKVISQTQAHYDDAIKAIIEYIG
ncbi:MAG: hypothetical protein R3Y27_04990 [Clostridia bacterium]